MAGANLKKSEDFVTNTTAASKYVPRDIESSNLHHEKLEIMDFLHSNPLSMDIKSYVLIFCRKDRAF
jgi:hypothetical protein